MLHWQVIMSKKGSGLVDDIVLLKLRYSGIQAPQFQRLIHAYPNFLSFSEDDLLNLLSKTEIKKWFGDTAAQYKRISEDYILTSLYDASVKFITINSQCYSTLLKEIYDFPPILFYRGDISLLNSNTTLAVVGSRKATSYSYKALDFLFSQFNRRFTIVSGLAKGADSMAHELAIQHHHATIAVLGFGHLTHYPKETYILRQKIEAHHLSISEYLPFEPVTKYHFPQRNRLISGISKGVLITEAEKRSGSQITIAHALDQNRNVYVLPGDLFNPLTQGNLYRAREGACIVTGAEDILMDYDINKVF